MSKKLISMLLVLCMVVAMSPTFEIDLTAFAAEAETAAAESWEYSINSDGTATLTKYTGTAEDVYIPSTVTDENGERISVTALGEGVFKNNTGINSATFGEGITTIGASAFEGATNLVCIVSPETLTTIGDRAFYGCDVFNSVILYDAVTSIGTDVFSECPNATVWVNEGSFAHTYAVESKIPFELVSEDAEPEIYIQDGVTYYIMNGEAYATACDGSVTELVIPAIIEGYPVVDIRTAFRESDIVSITLPASISEIADLAFISCKKLVDINISDGIEKIGKSAFQNCISLQSIVIPDTAEISAAEYLFAYCSNLTEVTLPQKTSAIPERMFYRCKNMEYFEIPSGVIDIGDQAFGECEKLETVIFSDGLERISNGAFIYCYSLLNVDFPDSIEIIGDEAFFNCKKLTEITLPRNIKSIGSKAFNSPNVASVVIPKSVTSIHSSSFSSSTFWCVYESSYAHTYAVENNCMYISSENDILPTIETYTKDNITYIVTDKEAFVWHGDASLSEGIISATILEKPVTKILPYAFEQRTELKSIKIPGSVTHIGEFAFFQCSALKNVEISDGVTHISDDAFYGCRALENIELPDSVSYIGDGAFVYCSALKNISIPDSVEYIGSGAFQSCALVEFEWPKSLKEIKNRTFTDCVNLTTISIPEGVEVIGEEAFQNCTKLQTIDLPDSVTSIGNHAFRYCTALTEFTFPAGVTTINNIFGESTSLKSITLPDGVTDIGSSAFMSLNNLTDINIPDTVQTIGSNAFSGCFSLDKLILPECITSISGVDAFDSGTVLIVYEKSYAHTYAEQNGYNFIFYEDGVEEFEIYIEDGIKYIVMDGEVAVLRCDLTAKTANILTSINGCPVTSIRPLAFRDCDSLVSIDIPDSVTTIGERAFYACDSLQSVEFPANITKIEDKTFMWCDKITMITIPDKVTTIGKSAFEYCRRLERVSVPDGVVSIGERAFAYCEYSLESIELPDSVDSIGGSAFLYCRTLKNIRMPSKMTFLGGGAFERCSNLVEIVIPEGITSINNAMFSWCADLEHITIPESVTSIGANVFYNCNSLKQIRIPRTAEINYSGVASTTILLVYENSPAHIYAAENNLLHFVLRETSNPEISYGAGISGTVTLDGVPASGAEVSLLYDDGVVKETVTTDANGAYSFTYAEVGAYTIRAKYAGTSGTEKVSVKRMNAFDVFLAGETDIVLKGAYTVFGTVSPVSATVTLTDTNGNIIETVTVTDGAYSFANVPNGAYIVKAETANGTSAKEITVFNADVTVESIVIEAVSTATITGTVDVEDRDGGRHKKIWVNVSLYNEEGIAVAQTKTKEDGTYTFGNVSIGKYSLVAETEEMRPDKKHRFERNHKITGYAYVDITEATTYTVDITGYEENESLSTISGKVTAQGETQSCEVILTNVFRHEVAKCTTGNNGKYTFKNVRDGMYFITARTQSDGMGFTVVVVRNGKVYGETDIFVLKPDKIHNRENNFPRYETEDDVRNHRDRIAEEKRWYDSLSEKEKKHCSKDYVDRLNKYCKWISECEASSNYSGATLSGGEQLLSGDELESGKTYELVLNIEETTEVEMGEDGIENEKQFNQKTIEDTAKDKSIAKYYNINLMKKDSEGGSYAITSIARDTDTTGKVRITMDIPEEHRGHKHYHFVHIHNGEPMTLVDLDDNPDTITFEIDRFSTFALTYTDNQLAIDGDIEEEIEKKSIVLGSTMTLANSLTMSVYLNTAESDPTDKVVVEHIFKDGRESEKTEKLVSECDPSDLGGEMYMVTIDTIAAKEMSDEIKVTVYTAEGIQKSVDYTTSVRAYAMRLFETTTDEELKRVVVNMLNYGAAAQDFFGYNEDDKANKLLTDEMKAYASEKVEVTTDTMVKGKNFAGTTLTLESNIILTGYFAKNDADVSKLRAKASFTDHYGNAKTQEIGSEKFNMSLSGAGYFGVDVTKVVVADLKQPVTVTVTDEDGSIYGEATFSIENYIAGAGNASQAVVSEELAKFAMSAYNYFR